MHGGPRMEGSLLCRCRAGITTQLAAFPAAGSRAPAVYTSRERPSPMTFSTSAHMDCRKNTLDAGPRIVAGQLTAGTPRNGRMELSVMHWHISSVMHSLTCWRPALTPCSSPPTDDAVPCRSRRRDTRPSRRRRIASMPALRSSPHTRRKKRGG